MSKKHYRHGNQPGAHDWGAPQGNAQQTASSSDLESNILARLGLGGEGTEEWQKQIRRVEQIAEEGKSDAVERISPYLKHPHEAVRMAAVRGMLKLEKGSPGLVPPLPFIDALYDQHPQVRATAVEALTAYGARRLPGAILDDVKNRLKNGSKGENEVVRMLIVHLLASLGGSTPIELLVAALQDEHWQVREAAVLALAPFMNRLSDAQRQQLDAMLYDDDAFVREATLLILGGQAPKGRLRSSLRRPESEKRSQAARVLAEMGDHSEETLDALQTIVQDPQTKSEVLEATLLAMAELHMPLDDEMLSRLLTDKDESIREAAWILRDTFTPRPNPSGEDESDTTNPASDKVTDLGQWKKRKVTPKDEDEQGE